LQEKKIRPVGENIERPVDFTLVTATHRDLKAEVQNGRFRSDLYYRVSVVPLYIPPLRQRPEDIPILISAFSAIYAAKYKFKVPRFSPAALELLGRRLWSGNVRELKNLVEYVVVVHHDKSTIEIGDLPVSAEGLEKKSVVTLNFDSMALPTVEELTNEYIRYVLERVEMHKGEAARILGLNRRTIYRKLKDAIEAGRRDGGGSYIQ
jgi:transcriptional regulator with PAS, ATPase and Fis domain